MSHSLKAQRAEQKRQPVEYDDDAYTESLLACIRSGQVEPSQYVAHVEAGDLNQGASDGRNTEN